MLSVGRPIPAPWLAPAEQVLRGTAPDTCPEAINDGPDIAGFARIAADASRSSPGASEQVEVARAAPARRRVPGAPVDIYGCNRLFWNRGGLLARRRPTHPVKNPYV